MLSFAPALLALVLAAGQAAPPAPVSIESKARDFVTNFAAGRLQVAAKDFNQQMASVITPTALAQLRKDVEAAVGRFQSLGSAKHFRADEFRVVELVAKHEHSSVSFRVQFDDYDRIGAIFADPIVAPKIDPALEDVARQFLARFNDKQYGLAVGVFDFSMRKQLPPFKLAELGQAIATQFGAFQSITKTTQVVDGEYRIVTILTKFEKGPVEVRLVFNGDGTVGGLRIAPPEVAR